MKTVFTVNTKYFYASPVSFYFTKTFERLQRLYLAAAVAIYGHSPVYTMVGRMLNVTHTHVRPVPELLVNIARVR